MKKVIAVLLALVLAFALFACSSKSPGTSASPSPSAAASKAPSAAPSAAPSPSAAATSASPAASASPSAAASADPSTKADKTGFFSSGVDPKSRKTYKLTWAYPYSLLLFDKMAECYKQYEDKLNVKMTTMSGTRGDVDGFIISLQTIADKTDGFMLVLEVTAKQRIIEILNETKKPYVCLFNSYKDAKGASLVPTVGTDQYNAGVRSLQWLADNYTKYWGDIDKSKIALLWMTMSTSPDLHERAQATADQFLKLFPNNSKQVFKVDSASQSGDGTEIAYNMASATFSANPDVKYWFATGTLEMYAQGIARATEALHMNNRVLIVDIGSDVLCSEWDTGYDGAWKSCLGQSNYLYAAPSICGVVSMLDGKSTPASLWPDRLKPGDKAAFYTTTYDMLTKDTYKTYFNGVAKDAGMPLPYK